MSGRSQQSSFRKHRTEPDQLSRFCSVEMRLTHNSIQKGPFKYEPLQNIAHPIQPEDDVSIRDPTLRTVDRSKLSQSLYQNNSGQISLHDKPPQSEQDESPFLIAFPARHAETRKRTRSKQISYFLEKLRRKFRWDSLALQFSYLYDQENNQNETNWAFLPSSRVIKTWNIAFFFILHLIAVYVPLSTTFNLPDLNYPFFILKTFDIVIQLTSSYTLNGLFVANFRQISIRYCGTNLFHDFVMVICLILSSSIIDSSNFYVLICLLFSIIRRYFELEMTLKFEYNLFHPIVQMAFALIKIGLIIHISTCFYHGLFDNEETRYLYAFNIILSIYTFNSNYTPQIQGEILYYCLISFTSLLVFAFLLTQCISIFKKSRVTEQLSEFLAVNKLDSNLKLKIINHIFNQPKFYHNQFISKLSGQLMQEFNRAQRSQLLTKYFKFYNQHTISTLVNCCEDLICQPNQVIVSDTEQDDCSLYFILEGNFKVVNRMGVQLQLLGPEQTFGEISFYTQQPRSAAIISEGVCRLLRIRREVFLSLLTFNDKQLFCSMKDRIIIHRDLPCQCYCCHSFEHFITKCPLLTFKADREKVVKQFTYPKKNSRKLYKRRTNRDMRATEFLKDALINQDFLLQLYSDNHFQSSNQFSQSNLPYEDVYIKDSYASAQSYSRVSREKSLLKSTSLLKEKSNYDQQQSIMNDVFMETTDKQYIAHEGEMDDDKFISLVRKDQQKNTFATAGFGNQGQSIKDQKSLNVILENESSENSPSLENVLELEQPIRKKDPKLTFNYNFENQMNDLQNKYSQYQRNASESINNSMLRQENRQTSIRQNSNRSQTYSPLTSNNLTANSHRSILRGDNSGTPSQPGRHRKSTNSNYTARSISGINKQHTDSPDIKSRKGTNRKRSTKTGTKISITPSQFMPFSGVDNPIDQYFGDVDFEKLYLFENYFPYNNYDVTIYQAQKNRGRKLKKLSPYFLSFRQAVQIQRLKAKQKSVIR